MANDSRRVSQLNITTTVSANDRVLVLTNPASNTPNTQTITFNNLSVLMANTFLPIANTSSLGVVKVDGNTVSIAANGVLTANVGNVKEGVFPLTIVSNTTNYTVTTEDVILFVDPNSVDANVRVILPTTGVDVGQEFYIKNINPGANHTVNVTTDAGVSSNSNYVEEHVTGTFVVTVPMGTKGESHTWMWDGTVYRHIAELNPEPVFYASTNSYHQVAAENPSAANDASTDWVAYNNQGNYLTGDGPFVDMGINSNTYSDTTYGNIWGPSDSYLYNYGGNLIIGPQTNHSIKFLAGNTNAQDVKLVVNTTAIFANLDIIPNTNSFNLGNSSNHWNALYVANAIISSNVEGDATGIDFYTPDTSSYIGMTYGPNPSSGNSSYLYWEKEGSGPSHFLGVQVWKGASESWSQWTFGSNGSITFPDSSIQNTAYQIVKSGFNVQYPSIRMDNVMFSIDNAGHPTVGAITGTWEGPWEAEARLWDGTSSFVTTSYGSTSTTWTSIASYGIGVTFGHPGDRVTGTFTDGTNGHIYRVTWIATASGPSTGYGFIIIEKLV
jgi:hypothetical protein